MTPFVVRSCIAPQYVTPCQLQSARCYALWSRGLKASWVIECLSEISACPSPTISYAAGLLLGPDTFIRCEHLHMLTPCLCYLQCCCTQTARAELKHINRSQWLQLDYKDTQFLFCLIMRGLLWHAHRRCCGSTEPPLICSTTWRPCTCWVLSLLQRKWRNYCIIHFQLESCLNAYNATANPNTLPSLTSAGSLKPITSSWQIVNHCLILCVCSICFVSLHRWL